MCIFLAMLLRKVDFLISFHLSSIVFLRNLIFFKDVACNCKTSTWRKIILIIPRFVICFLKDLSSFHFIFRVSNYLQEKRIIVPNLRHEMKNVNKKNVIIYITTLHV